MRQYQMYIGGEWVDSLSGEWYEDMNPYTGEPFARVPSGSRADTAQAVSAAQAAFPEWSATLPGERQALFLKAAEVERHRVQPGGTDAGGEGRTAPQARGPGAGWPQSPPHPQGRGHRLRRGRGHFRRLPAPGADLHVGTQDHRRGRGRAGVHGEVRRQGEHSEGGGPQGDGHSYRPADKPGATEQGEAQR